MGHEAADAVDLLAEILSPEQAERRDRDFSSSLEIRLRTVRSPSARLVCSSIRLISLMNRPNSLVSPPMFAEGMIKALLPDDCLREFRGDVTLIDVEMVGTRRADGEPLPRVRLAHPGK